MKIKLKKAGPKQTKGRGGGFKKEGNPPAASGPQGHFRRNDVKH
jgi:hypothetical protein